MRSTRYLLAGALLMLLIMMMMLFAGVCYANITVQEASKLPGDGFYSDNPFPNQAIPVSAIKNEVSYLSQNKIFAAKQFNICLYNYQVYRMSNDKKVAYGGTSYLGNIYIFTGFWNTDTVSSAVVHEIGHMIRKYYISDDDLQTYITNRGVKDGVLLDGCASVKEELFAEDFRTLFGDDHAKVNMYSFYNTIKPPTEKDREFILKHIDGQASAITLASAIPAH